MYLSISARKLLIFLKINLRGYYGLCFCRNIENTEFEFGAELFRSRQKCKQTEIVSNILTASCFAIYSEN